MGGEATAVTLDTRRHLHRAAFCVAGVESGRPRRFNFSTDAAHRSNAASISPPRRHVSTSHACLLDICGTASGARRSDRGSDPALPERKPVRMRLSVAAR